MLVVFDPSDYRDELQSLDVSEEQAAAMLAVLWDIMRSFVELGFGVDSVSAILPEAFEGGRKSASARVGNTIKYTSTDKILNESFPVDLGGDKDSE